MNSSNRYPATISKVFTFVFCFAVLCNPAFAGMISSVQMFGTQAGTGPGLGDVSIPVILTVNINNDNQPGVGPLFQDNNITVPIKRFDHNGDIDMVFNVAPTNGGVTEYKVYESVDNNTGINWAGYTMQLGFGIGPLFVPSPAFDGLDFDFPNFDTPPVSSAFANVLLGEDVLVFSNGIHSSGSETYQFRIDVPDLPDSAGRVATFTIRQTPLPVPEPGTLVLLGIGLSGIVFIARRRS
jgi:hypothetical protein